MTGAVSVEASTVSILEAGPGASPRAALHGLRVVPIPFRVAKPVLVREHYLHSMPGGTRLAFGILRDGRLMGALTLGAGPKLAYRLVDGAEPYDCATLSRFWLSDDLPSNAESRVLGIVLRALRRNTNIKFIVAYADPSRGHIGTIYQATGWLYTGLSSAMSLYDLGDGKLHHSRSLGHTFGSHSVRHFEAQGVHIKLVRQAAKHRYVYLLDPTCRERLTVPVLPYPKRSVR